MFGLNCILRYIISHIYHLSVSEFEKFLIFSIDFIFICDFSWIEIYGVLGVRSKEIWMSEKSYGFA